MHVNEPGNDQSTVGVDNATRRAKSLPDFANNAIVYSHIAIASGRSAAVDNSPRLDDQIMHWNS
jgi:hypothetical protein